MMVQETFGFCVFLPASLHSIRHGLWWDLTKLLPRFLLQEGSGSKSDAGRNAMLLDIT